jgi:hypothetical protein
MHMHSKRVIIVAQVFISGMMAFLMTGFFSFLNLGFSVKALGTWAAAFVVAWPVAFCLSLLVSPLAFMLAGRLAAPGRD